MIKSVKKRIMSLFLATVIAISFISGGMLSASAEASGDGWSLDGDGLLTIMSNTGMMNWINNGRSHNREAVRIVVIQNGVTSIGSWAFDGCTGLTSVTIGNGVTSIGNWAFAYCTALTEITIPDSVTSIGSSAFSGCAKLTSVTIGNSVTSTVEGAFFGCTALTEIKVSADNQNYSDIDGVLFNKTATTLLQYPPGKQGSYTIPDNVTSIGVRAFGYCTGLTSVTIGNAVTSIGDFAFQYAGLTEITIPDKVTGIPNQAFSGCAGLTSVTIGNGVTVIGYAAFSGCTRLTEITIPDSVTSIEASAFSDTAFLNNQPDGVVYAGNWVIKYKGSMPSNTSVILRNDTRGVADSAFQNQLNLSEMHLPDSVESIGHSAFDGCTGLMEIEIPNGVTSIGAYAFNRCTGLTEIIIPDSVTGIDRGAFSGCTGLTEIIIPDGVITIGERAFSYCTGLTSVTIGNSVTSIGDFAFEECRGLISVTLGNSVESIGDYAFYRLELTEIIIPDSVITIGERAFSFCTELTEIIIPNRVTSIGERAFSSCTGLTSVTIGNNVERIDRGTFSNCTGLTEIIIPDSVISIGNSAFSNCTGLTEIIIPDSVTSIGNMAFSNCTGLTEITIPDSVTSIGDYAFSGTPLHYGYNEVVYVGKWAVAYNGTLPSNTSITLRNDTRGVADSAFSSLPNLTSIIISDSVTNIGNWVFYNCTELMSVTFKSKTPPLFGDSDVFRDVPSSMTVYVPLGAKMVYEEVAVLGGYAIKELGLFPCGEHCKGVEECDEPCIKPVIGTDWTLDGDGLLTITSDSGMLDWAGNGRNFPANRNAVRAVTIQDGVTNIGNETFSGCTGLTEIIIPDSVTSIGNMAFYNCTELMSVTLGNAVESIGRGAFSNTAWHYNQPNGLVYAGNWVIEYKGTISPNTSITLLNDTRGVADSAFQNQSNLTAIAIPDSVISIGYSAFSGCTALTEITIPDSVTSIGNAAFANCAGLTSVTIGTGVISIGTAAFAASFFVSTSLTSVVFKSQTPPVLDYEVFFGVPSSMTVYVPMGAKAAYEAVGELRRFNIIEGEPKHEYRLGDCNHDGKINIADLTYLKRVVVGYMPEIFINHPECWLDPETRAEENPMPKAADITRLKDFLTGKSRTLTD
ncbi:MAG: leucine-rich repeat protein [Oscillospiraceae bacterium]|nr:leucine-rich repeat protein [Oscillospiraceae bacterium]